MLLAACKTVKKVKLTEMLDSSQNCLTMNSGISSEKFKVYFQCHIMNKKAATTKMSILF